MAESNNDIKSQEKHEKTVSFFTRLASTCVLIIVGGGCIVLGGLPLAVLLTLISVCGVYELLRVFQVEKSALAVPTFLATVAYDVLLYLNLMQYAVFLVIIYFLILLTIYVFLYPKYEIKQVMSVFFSFFYLVVCLGYIYMIRCFTNGLLFAVLILVCTCGNDMCAYLVGILIGKHKMFPTLSPKKSVEGFIGGIVGAAILGAIYGAVFRNYADYGDLNYVLIFSIVSAIGALPAVVGDLAASAIKRNYGVKDYGHLIPGHGGVMDRFDSMLFTAPIIYYLVTFILQIQA
jgi:phosphatidate cytidylyltransferase